MDKSKYKISGLERNSETKNFETEENSLIRMSEDHKDLIKLKYKKNYIKNNCEQIIIHVITWTNTNQGKQLYTYSIYLKFGGVLYLYFSFHEGMLTAVTAIRSWTELKTKMYFPHTDNVLFIVDEHSDTADATRYGPFYSNYSSNGTVVNVIQAVYWCFADFSDGFARRFEKYLQDNMLETVVLGQILNRTNKGGAVNWSVERISYDDRTLDVNIAGFFRNYMDYKCYWKNTVNLGFTFLNETQTDHYYKYDLDYYERCIEEIAYRLLSKDDNKDANILYLYNEDYFTVGVSDVSKSQQLFPSMDNFVIKYLPNSLAFYSPIGASADFYLTNLLWKNNEYRYNFVILKLDDIDFISSNVDIQFPILGPLQGISTKLLYSNMRFLYSLYNNWAFERNEMSTKNLYSQPYYRQIAEQYGWAVGSNEYNLDRSVRITLFPLSKENVIGNSPYWFKTIDVSQHDAPTGGIKPSMKYMTMQEREQRGNW